MSTKCRFLLTSNAALNTAKNQAEAFRAKKEAAEKKKELKSRAEDEAITKAENSLRVVRARLAVMPVAQIEQRVRPMSECRQDQAAMAYIIRSAVDCMLALGQDV